MIVIGNESSYQNSTAADAALSQRNQPSQIGRPLEVFSPPVENPPQNRVATPEQIAQTVAQNQGNGVDSSQSNTGQLLNVHA